MTVYVDDMEAPYRRMKMCHMIADSTEELLSMAKAIGVSARWIQRPGTPYEHFDICLAKKALALEHGARAITFMELGRIVGKRAGLLREKRRKRG